MDRIVDFDIETDMPADRVRAWNRVLDENLLGIECKNAGEDMRAALKSRLVDSGSITRARFTRQTMCRTPAHIQQATEDTAVVVFVEEGRHVVRQGHRSASLDGPGIYCLDSMQPFEVDFASAEVKQSALHVPKAALTRRIGAIEDIAFGPESPMQRLVSTFAGGLCASFEDHDAETLNALLNQTLDLFALMVAQRKRNCIDPSTHRAGTLVRIKAYIKAHLHDDDLTLERAARALGISSRYLNHLLATEGTSFGRVLLAMRLEGARREIMDPRRFHRQVTEVAYDWGFKNASHFGRAFREKYGMTPRDAKER